MVPNNQRKNGLTMGVPSHKYWNSEKADIWTTCFMKHIYLLFQNIWKYSLENEFRPNEQVIEAHLQKIIRLWVEAAYEDKCRVTSYHKRLLSTITTRRLICSRAVSTQGLSYIITAIESYNKIKEKEFQKSKKQISYCHK